MGTSLIKIAASTTLLLSPSYSQASPPAHSSNKSWSLASEEISQAHTSNDEKCAQLLRDLKNAIGDEFTFSRYAGMKIIGTQDGIDIFLTYYGAMDSYYRYSLDFTHKDLNYRYDRYLEKEDVTFSRGSEGYGAKLAQLIDQLTRLKDTTPNLSSEDQSIFDLTLCLLTKALAVSEVP